MQNGSNWSNEEFFAGVETSKEELQDLRELNAKIRVMAEQLRNTKNEMNCLKRDLASVQIKILNYELFK